VLNEKNIEADQSPVTPLMLRDLFSSMDGGEISGKIAKGVFKTMCSTGKTARSIIEEQGLQQVSDQESIEAVVDEVLSENQTVVLDVKGGKGKAYGYLVGQVMKKTGGRANPRLVNELLRKKIEKG
jgi:aspartyl-tRNA(Asn)/glutamyl-tRNA(Gln) amidotransferase subunit B